MPCVMASPRHVASTGHLDRLSSPGDPTARTSTKACRGTHEPTPGLDDSRMSEPRELPPPLRDRAFDVAEAVGRGILADRLRRNDLVAPFHGVRRPAHHEVEHADCIAYATRMPATHVFSHITAARLLDMPLPARFTRDARVHVTAVNGRAPRGKGVAGYATRREPAIRRAAGGLRVTSALRTWTDLASQLSVDELVEAGDRLVGRPSPLSTHAEMAQAVGASAGLRGHRALVRAFELVRPGSRSPRETRARLTLVRAGLPEPELNAEIVLRRRTIHGDLVYRRWRVLIEYEGDQHRKDPRQWAHDLERYNDLAEAGWLVIRASKTMTEPDLAARAARALRSRGWST